jgi:hypothetical protein
LRRSLASHGAGSRGGPGQAEVARLPCRGPALPDAALGGAPGDALPCPPRQDDRKEEGQAEKHSVTRLGGTVAALDLGEPLAARRVGVPRRPRPGNRGLVLLPPDPAGHGSERGLHRDAVDRRPPPLSIVRRVRILPGDESLTARLPGVDRPCALDRSPLDGGERSREGAEGNADREEQVSLHRGCGIYRQPSAPPINPRRGGPSPKGGTAHETPRDPDRPGPARLRTRE